MLCEWLPKDTKLEMHRVTGKKHDEEPVCRGVLCRVLSDTLVEICCSVLSTHLMEQAGCYQVIFYLKNSVLSCSVYITEQYQQEDLQYLVLRIVSPLERLQRRSYHRSTCRSEFCYCILQSDQFHDMMNEEYNQIPTEYIEATGTSMIHQSLIDIGGGGIRFKTDHLLQKNTCLLLCFPYSDQSQDMKLYAVGEVVSFAPVYHQEGMYDVRVQFCRIAEEHRAMIIRYGFKLDAKQWLEAN